MMLAEAGPQVMVAVAHAVDHRNPITQGHSSRIVAIADAIGRRAGVDSSDMENLRAAAFLHDVGHMTLTTGGEGFEAPGHAEEGEKVVAGLRAAGAGVRRLVRPSSASARGGARGHPPHRASGAARPRPP